MLLNTGFSGDEASTRLALARMPVFCLFYNHSAKTGKTSSNGFILAVDFSSFISRLDPLARVPLIRVGFALLRW